MTEGSAALPKRLLLLGCTGRMGRCVAPILARLPGVSLGVGGRSPTEVATLAAELGAAPVVIGTLTDEARLREILTDWDVVINAAGPEQEVVLPVLRSCIATRTDYGDIAAETSVTLASLDLGPQAEAAGVSALCGIGTMPAATCLLAHRAIEGLDSVESVLIGMTYPTPDCDTCEGYAEEFRSGQGSATWHTMLFAPIDGAMIKHAGEIVPVIGSWENRREIVYPHGPRLPGIISNFPEVVLIDRRFKDIPSIAVAVSLDSAVAGSAWKTALDDVHAGVTRSASGATFFAAMTKDTRKDEALVSLGKIPLANAIGRRGGERVLHAVQTTEWVPTEGLMAVMAEWLLRDDKPNGVFMAEDVFDAETFFGRAYRLMGRTVPEEGLFTEEVIPAP